MNRLGINKAPAQTRVVVAMSGGVDSSVVAALLKDQGYEVIGLTMQLYDHGMAVGKKGACCAGQDIQDARDVAQRIQIPHYVLNYESKFRQSVMDDFVASYLAGETPIPCIKCNQSVKFKDMLGMARDLGADVMATGHYVQRVVSSDGAVKLLRAADAGKDQSYFLFATTREQLDFLRFPLGGMQKEETRALAEKYQLPVYDKPDSQDICFVPQGNYAAVIEKLHPGAAESGDIVHLSGEVLGQHHGIIHYTVGQRKGLNIAYKEPLYVIRVDAATRQVIVGGREALYTRSFIVRDFNWLAQMPLTTPRDVQVKLRSAQPLMPAQAELLTETQARVTLLDPWQSVAPGQACVMYEQEEVLGGGWITKS